MLRYPKENIIEIEISCRKAYFAIRPDFLPTAYVVLTRESRLRRQKLYG